MGVPVFVVSPTIPGGWPRQDAPFTFVTDGIESALAQAKAIAGEKLAGVAGAASPSSASALGCWRRSW